MKKNEKNNSSEKTLKITTLGILSALALTLSFIESLFPPVPGLPPGAKPGLANIVTMFTAGSFGFGSAMAVTLVKSLFAGTRGITAFFMSLSGGTLSTITMCALIKRKNTPFGLVGISIVSAIAHNIGQLIVACIISGTTKLLIYYGPLLVVFGIIAGTITGTVLSILLPVVEKQSVKWKK